MIGGVQPVLGSSLNLVPGLEPGDETKSLKMTGKMPVPQAISEALGDCFTPLVIISWGLAPPSREIRRCGTVTK